MCIQNPSIILCHELLELSYAVDCGVKNHFDAASSIYFAMPANKFQGDAIDPRQLTDKFPGQCINMLKLFTRSTALITARTGSPDSIARLNKYLSMDATL